MHTKTFTDFLKTENERNMKNAPVFERFIRLATGNPETQVMVGHHIDFLGTTENGDDVTIEVPSADSLMFCPELMERVFGSAYMDVMLKLVAVPIAQRQGVLADAMDAKYGPAPVEREVWTHSAEEILEG